MNSFFRAAEVGKTDKINSRQELWGFLLTITRRKLHRQYERVNAAKRRSHGQVSLDASHFEIADTGCEQIFSCCDELFETLKDPILKTVAAMRLEGFTVAEIAQELQVAIATIKRRLSRIRELWSEEVELTAAEQS